MNVGERIRLLRKQKGMTQQELAQKLGLKDSAIAKYENGRVENIKRSTLSEMAKVLGCSPIYLLGLDQEIDFILKDEEKQLIIEYRNTDDATKEMVRRTLAYAKAIKSNTNKQSND